MESVAVIAVMLLALVGGFQMVLAAGAPLGRAAWGGQHEGVLPGKLRMASAVAGLIVYPAIAIVVLMAGGVMGDGWSGPAAKVTMWALTGVFVLGTILNLASRSRAERLWAIVSAGIALCCGIIAAGL